MSRSVTVRIKRPKGQTACFYADNVRIETAKAVADNAEDVLQDKQGRLRRAMTRGLIDGLQIRRYEERVTFSWKKRPKINTVSALTILAVAVAVVKILVEVLA